MCTDLPELSDLADPADLPIVSPQTVPGQQCPGFRPTSSANDPQDQRASAKHEALPVWELGWSEFGAGS